MKVCGKPEKITLYFQRQSVYIVIPQLRGYLACVMHLREKCGRPKKP